MCVEGGDGTINRAPTGVAVLTVGCRHIGYDWFWLGWIGIGPQAVSHGNWVSRRTRKILWARCGIGAVPGSRSHWPRGVDAFAAAGYSETTGQRVVDTEQ
jgi:hypothetical protein